MPVLLKDGFDRSQKLKIISILDIVKLETGYYNFDNELIKLFFSITYANILHIFEVEDE